MAKRTFFGIGIAYLVYFIPAFIFYCNSLNISISNKFFFDVIIEYLFYTSMTAIFFWVIFLIYNSILQKLCARFSKKPIFYDFVFVTLWVAVLVIIVFANYQDYIDKDDAGRIMQSVLAQIPVFIFVIIATISNRFFMAKKS